jgi:hypothetical protein
VNGQLIDNERQLRHGDRILLGCSHFFRLNFPGDKSKMFELNRLLMNLLFRFIE